MFIGDGNVYRKVTYKEKLLSELVDKSSAFFKELERKGCILDETLKYFTYEYEKSANLEKLHNCLNNVPGRTVISTCGAPTEKASQFLNFHLNRVLQNVFAVSK